MVKFQYYWNCCFLLGRSGRKTASYLLWGSFSSTGTTVSFWVDLLVTELEHAWCISVKCGVLGIVNNHVTFVRKLLRQYSTRCAAAFIYRYMIVSMRKDALQITCLGT